MTSLIQVVSLDELQQFVQHPTITELGPLESNVSSILKDSLGNLVCNLPRELCFSVFRLSTSWHRAANGIRQPSKTLPDATS